ncbi:putative transcription regulator mTERF family [Medicago truncatula]|uniref:Putative transcription regulator mTERF family n=1 Tax=Medicago truncatula TaxID=3880 RepID=G7LF49_MEDTR|nr:transcription termination factor MTERF2, chloroplastic [Medicago truncatula]AET01407.1 transcription termination factor family protein [Medicago truncatula]RHN38988.1 putative transcription regulator mTERF family [Medicago truncatula]
MLRFLSIGSKKIHHLTFTTAVIKVFPVFTPATYSTKVPAQNEVELQNVKDEWKDATEVLSKWGCGDDDLTRIFTRCPSLRNADPSQVQSKLRLLSDLGLGSAELVKIINCRPRFFRTRLNHNFDERLDSLMSVFDSKAMLHKAIARNPSLLCENSYDIERIVKQYEELGVPKRDLVQMMILRPTVISRTSFDDEKMEYISRIGLSKDSKLYKYVVTLIGISRVETIREKVLNFTKYGFSDDEIFCLFGKSPNILTLSIDKVQRNMTFILGTMKLEANIIFTYPYLLFSNMETVLKPRVLLAMKVQNMDSNMKTPSILRALRMSEERFFNTFVRCHDKEIADELMEFYKRTKQVKRLAVSSRNWTTRGFPF